ncbi:MAG: DUF3038 domain-containing protein [Cyanobacteria bacterium J06641_5]
MSNPASVTAEESSAGGATSSPPASKPAILASLPDYPVAPSGCSPHTQRELDLLLLAMEALEFAGGERFLAALKDMQLRSLVKGRLALWQLRRTNPWRRAYQRQSLQLDQAKVLVLILNYRVKQQTALIRQVLMARQQLQEKGLPFSQNPRLAAYLERFRAHFRTRMNPRRAKVAAYLAEPDRLDTLAITLLERLLFGTGTAGILRLWSSLFDGEVTGEVAKA